MRCDRCRHWEKPDSDEFEPSWRREFGRCKRIPHSEDIGEWVLDDDDDDGARWELSQEYADRTAVAQDGSGYHACVLTKPEHFCAMFAASEPEPRQ